MDITSFFLLVVTGSAGLIQYSIPVTVTINPVYNLGLEVDVITEYVVAGGNITTEVKLEKTGPAGKITVDLNYSILNMRKQVLVRGSAGQVDIIDEAKKNVTVSVPLFIKPGRYALNITASHHQAREVSDYEYFLVSKKIRWDLFKYFLESFKRILGS